MGQMVCTILHQWRGEGLALLPSLRGGGSGALGAGGQPLVSFFPLGGRGLFLGAPAPLGFLYPSRNSTGSSPWGGVSEKIVGDHALRKRGTPAVLAEHPNGRPIDQLWAKNSENSPRHPPRGGETGVHSPAREGGLASTRIHRKHASPACPAPRPFYTSRGAWRVFGGSHTQLGIPRRRWPQ